MKERMEEHRRNPVCASCHAPMDPLGFALENFDAIGAWRERDGDSRVDASGTLVDGTKVVGPADLNAAMLANADLFVTNVVERPDGVKIAAWRPYSVTLGTLSYSPIPTVIRLGKEHPLGQ